MPRTKTTIDAATRGMMIVNYRKGMSLRQLEEKYGISYGTIRRCFTALEKKTGDPILRRPKSTEANAIICNICNGEIVETTEAIENLCNKHQKELRHILSLDWTEARLIFHSVKQLRQGK